MGINRDITCLCCRNFVILGNRDVVGFGLNGELSYGERVTQPFPSVRFKENTPELLALRQKAKGDWKNLTLEEKKTCTITVHM